MASWGEMKPVHFDGQLVTTKVAAEVIRTADASLFPNLLPEAKPRKPATEPGQLPGQCAMFGSEDE